MSSNKANLIIIALAVAVLAGGAYLLVVSQGNQAGQSAAAARLDLNEPMQVAPAEATLPKVVHDAESGTTYVSYAMPATRGSPLMTCAVQTAKKQTPTAALITVGMDLTVARRR